MKIAKLVFVLVILLSFGDILADDFKCLDVTGKVMIIPTPAGLCPVLKDKAKHFPNLEFLHELGVPQTCFIGFVDGKIGDTPIYGWTENGLTDNKYNDEELLTGAGTIKIYDAHDFKKIGRLFTQDTINLDGKNTKNTKEYQAMIAGTGDFKGVKGHVEILGNTLFAYAPFSGKLCLKK